MSDTEIRLAALERPMRRPLAGPLATLLAALCTACAVAGCARRDAPARGGPGPAVPTAGSRPDQPAEALEHGEPNGNGEYIEFGLAFKPPPGFTFSNYGPTGIYFECKGGGGGGGGAAPGGGEPAGLYVQPVYQADWSVRKWDQISRWNATMVDPEGNTGPLTWQDFAGNRSGLGARHTNVYTVVTEVGHLPNGHGWAAVVRRADGGAVSFVLSVAEGTDPSPFVEQAREMLASLRPVALPEPD